MQQFQGKNGDQAASKGAFNTLPAILLSSLKEHIGIKALQYYCVQIEEYSDQKYFGLEKKMILLIVLV